MTKLSPQYHTSPTIVVRKFDGNIADTVDLQSLQYTAKYTALWGASVKTESCGKLGAHFDSLNPIRESELCSELDQSRNALI